MGWQVLERWLRVYGLVATAGFGAEWTQELCRQYILFNYRSRVISGIKGSRSSSGPEEELLLSHDERLPELWRMPSTSFSVKLNFAIGNLTYMSQRKLDTVF